jgi:hypothetical protein
MTHHRTRDYLESLKLHLQKGKMSRGKGDNKGMHVCHAPHNLFCKVQRCSTPELFSVNMMQCHTHTPFPMLSGNSQSHLESTTPSTTKTTSLLALSVWTIHFETRTELHTDTNNNGYKLGHVTSR